MSRFHVYWDIWIPEIAEEFVLGDIHKSNDRDSHAIGSGWTSNMIVEVRILDFTGRGGAGGGGGGVTAWITR